jgi:surface polysaccharide O-acyltransferase-like enzyme
MDKYLSDKLRIISLISMIMVVFLHSYNVTVNFSSGNIHFNSVYNIFIQNFFSHGITKVAVPIFFCISGYLFFLNFRGSINEFVLKYRKRVKSLLLPYLLWSLWGLLFFFVLQLIPQSKKFFTNELIVNYSFGKILDTLFLNPLSYQLWFMRDLIVLVIFSPLIYLITKYFKAIPTILFLIIWLVFFKFNIYVFSNESILFFSLGAYFAINKREYLLKRLNQKYYWIFTFLWVLIVLLRTILANQNSEQTFLLLFLQKVSIIVGLIGLWSIYDILMAEKTNSNKAMLSISFFSFFIYAFHEPLLTLIKKGLFYFTGAGEMIAIINYFVAPILTIILSILTGLFIKKITPRFYSLLTGGR